MGNGFQNNQNPADTTPMGWIIFLWVCGFCVPCIGIWIVIIVSSILYYAWRDVTPNRAKTINANGWMIFVISFILQLVFGSVYWLMV